jgi:hypothetical protein
MNHDYMDEAREIVEWWRDSSYESKKEYEILVNQIAYELVKASKEGYESRP